MFGEVPVQDVGELGLTLAAFLDCPLQSIVTIPVGRGYSVKKSGALLEGSLCFLLGGASIFETELSTYRTIVHIGAFLVYRARPTYAAYTVAATQFPGSREVNSFFDEIRLIGIETSSVASSQASGNR